MSRVELVGLLLDSAPPKDPDAAYQGFELNVTMAADPALTDPDRRTASR